MSVSPSLSRDGRTVVGGRRRRGPLQRKLLLSLRYFPLQPGRLLSSQFPLLGVGFETRAADVAAVDVVVVAVVVVIVVVVVVVVAAAAPGDAAAATQG